MAVGAARVASGIDGGWLPPALDSPVRRRPLTTLVESAARPHRHLTTALAGVEGAVSEAVGSALDSSDPARGVRFAAGVATIHAAISGSPASVREALGWFGASARVPPGELESVAWDARPDDALVALLPYVLDPFGLTTRRALIAGRGCAVERDRRKETGTFYTPGDVARHLADRVIADGAQRVIDPACGAGVFLRAAFSRLCETLPAGAAARLLHGIDIEPAAVDACALVLVHDWLRREPLVPGESPSDRFAAIRGNLRAGDALRCSGGGEQLPLLGRDAGDDERFPGEFDVVLTNPPFAPLGRAAAGLETGYRSLRAAATPARVNMVWPFWELADRLGGADGRVGIVLPLSVACSTTPAARAGRQAVLRDADWEFGFFDRTPDALFGDDVKQRIALAVRRASGRRAVRVSSLRRWSADRRDAALATADSVVCPPGGDVIPKIGTAAEVRAIETLRASGETLAGSLSSARLASAEDLYRSSAAVAVMPTAYNWIGAYRDTTVAAEGRAGAAGPLAELRAESPDAADALYALLVSHVFLWWWRATGDLFHVPLALLRRAPFPLRRCGTAERDRLRDAGRACWDEALGEPVVSTNRGVTLVSYRPADDSLALARADDAVGRAFGLEPRFVRFTRDDARRLRIAGRGS